MSLEIVRQAFAKQVIKDDRSELQLAPDSLKEVSGTVHGTLRLVTFDEHGVRDIKEQEVLLVPDIASVASFAQVLEAAGAALMRLDENNRSWIVPSDLFPLRAWGHPDVASAANSIGSTAAEMRTRTAAGAYDAMFEGLAPLAPEERARIVQAWFRNEEPDWDLALDLADRPQFIDYIDRFLFRWTWRSHEFASWLSILSPALDVAPRMRVLRLFARVASHHDGWITEKLEAWPDARTELAALAASDPESAEGACMLIAQLDGDPRQR